MVCFVKGKKEIWECLWVFFVCVYAGCVWLSLICISPNCEISAETVKGIICLLSTSSVRTLVLRCVKNDCEESCKTVRCSLRVCVCECAWARASLSSILLKRVSTVNEWLMRQAEQTLCPNGTLMCGPVEMCSRGWFVLRADVCVWRRLTGVK